MDHRINTRVVNLPVHISPTSSSTGPRLTKAYDVTIQRYRNSHAKMKTIKCTFCGVWVHNFVWNFKGTLWNFTQNFEPIQRKIFILRGVKNFTTYDILELWHLKSLWDGPLTHFHCNITQYNSQFSLLPSRLFHCHPGIRMPAPVLMK